MRRPTKISKKQTSLFTAEGLISFPGDSHASHIQKLEKDLEQQMTATYGRKCLEQFGKFNRAGLFQKTFAALLLGMTGWSSTKSRLTWNLKVTKLSRFYFQLRVSMLPTDGTGFGLLPTPLVMDTNQGDLDTVDKRRERARLSKKNGNGFGMTVGELANRGLLPTPLSTQKPHNGEIVNGRMMYHQNSFSINLQDLATRNMLPTPRNRDWKGPGHHGEGGPDLSTALKGMILPTPSAGSSHSNHTMNEWGGAKNPIRKLPGMNFQLNPRFVAEMMGFPPDWTELPFLSGESIPSKDSATQ